MMAKKRFVGFGFGPIQSGLMLYEAQHSGNFDSYVVAEIEQALVDAVAANGNKVVINVAHADRVSSEVLTDVVLLNPNVPADRAKLCKAISQADELATAVPSANLYTAGGPNSIASLLAENVNPDRPQLLYASENNNFAAEVLEEAILKLTDRSRLRNFQILNTVIGKMSGVIRDEKLIAEMKLATMTPLLPRAVLVEEFNAIKVSRVRLPGVTKSIIVFDEKDDLLPFEEAKLFGHNAIHALLGYLAWHKGLKAMSDIRADRELFALGRKAFIEESGAALIRKHGKLGDPLFTPKGWQAYADDLLQRMTNPFLRDAVDRICRDPARKLAYGDRLVGTMRECLAQGVQPKLLASGAAAAVEFLVAEGGERKAVPAEQVRVRLEKLWEGEKDDGMKARVVGLITDAAKLP
jgi:mannitol-1-phosphate/altronate dehydrogenase